MPRVAYRCFAKLNLTLEVVGQRPDGFHEVASVIHTINVADDLLATEAAHLSCSMDGPPFDADENLVLRAGRLLARVTGRGGGAHLTLRKRIPIAAGLGGGSSDAAATLAALNRLWGAGLRGAALAGLAAELGSDVPLFLHGGAALITGRGEIVHYVQPLPTTWCVLLVPPHNLPNKTRSLYEALAPADFSDGSFSRQAADCLRAGNSIPERLFHNAFARAARQVFPDLEELWYRAEERLERPMYLSGAGPTLFALLPSAADARQAVSRLAALGAPTLVARTTIRGRAPLRMSYP